MTHLSLTFLLVDSSSGQKIRSLLLLNSLARAVTEVVSSHGFVAGFSESNRGSSEWVIVVDPFSTISRVDDRLAGTSASSRGVSSTDSYGYRGDAGDRIPPRITDPTDCVPSCCSHQSSAGPLERTT